jgi:hypothetical protein
MEAKLMFVLLFVLVVLSSIYYLFLLNSRLISAKYRFFADSVHSGQLEIFELFRLNTLFRNCGQIGVSCFPVSYKAKIFDLLKVLDIQINSWLENLGFAFIFLLIASLSSLPILWALALVLLCAVLIYPFVLENQSRVRLHEDTLHLALCLKILLISSEMPVNTAFHLIIAKLPTSMKYLENQMMKILDKSDKAGMKETLIHWQSSSSRFKNLLSILVSSLEGASKQALLESFDSFISKINEENKDQLQNEADNLQLYIIIPVSVMLLVVIYPMYSAINFVMNTTGL